MAPTLTGLLRIVGLVGFLTAAGACLGGEDEPCLDSNGNADASCTPPDTTSPDSTTAASTTPAAETPNQSTTPAPKKAFLEACTTNADCESDLCFNFNAKGLKCTIACTATGPACPAPSPGCSGMNVCRSP
jgi:hypothetical protein